MVVASSSSCSSDDMAGWGIGSQRRENVDRGFEVVVLIAGVFEGVAMDSNFKG